MIPFWLLVALYVIGAVYLFFVIIMAFKNRTMVVSLVALNIIIFIYTYFFAPDILLKYGLSGANLRGGGGYTLISYMFLHASIPHLFLNSLGLLFFGYNMEKQIGGPQTLVVYFTSGLIAGGFFAITSAPTALVVGASGAIFGLMAYLTLIRPFLISPMPFLIPMPVALAAVLYAIFAIPVFMSGQFPGNVAYNAHIGGLIGGSLMAFGMNYLQALKGLAIVVAIAVLTFMVPAILL